MTTSTLAGTFTTEGFIPHQAMQYAGGSFHAPVKLQLEQTGPSMGIAYGGRNGMRTPVPLRADGKLIYALPGGGDTRA